MGVETLRVSSDSYPFSVSGCAHRENVNFQNVVITFPTIPVAKHSLFLLLLFLSNPQCACARGYSCHPVCLSVML